MEVDAIDGGTVDVLDSCGADALADGFNVAGRAVDDCVAWEAIPETEDCRGDIVGAGRNGMFDR